MKSVYTKQENTRKNSKTLGVELVLIRKNRKRYGKTTLPKKNICDLINSANMKNAERKMRGVLSRSNYI